MPNGIVYFHSAENHQAALVSVDPFLCCEPEESILYLDDADVYDDEDYPPTLRDPSLPSMCL